MASPPIISLTTDFCVGSPYVAEMKGVILGIAPTAVIVDVTHGIEPQNVREGALVLRQVIPAFPLGSIHVAVIDPGVGTNRAILIAEIAGKFVIAPDNGLLWPLIQCQQSNVHVFRANQPQFWRDDVSATFHGRDVMAPLAAHLAKGVVMNELGESISEVVRLELPLPSRETLSGPRGDDYCDASAHVAEQLAGEVIYVDTFGNLVTNIHVSDLRKQQIVAAEMGGPPVKRIEQLVRTYGDAKAGTTVALFGSSGYLEVAVVNGHAGQRLGLAAGAPIRIRLA
ncbi:MAG: SAM-dependent chlorinase/fluorinase [Planctomycetales bacterium]|nr:SAM-dependent chlorinase/fluorinase [Planctomycetales bacterium]